MSALRVGGQVTGVCRGLLVGDGTAYLGFAPSALMEYGARDSGFSPSLGDVAANFAPLPSDILYGPLASGFSLSFGDLLAYLVAEPSPILYGSFASAF